MPVTDLIRVQMGKELTWGTAVAATALLAGVTDATLEVVDEVHHVKEKGYMGPSRMVADVRQTGAASIQMDLTYEDILFLLDGLYGACTPVGAGDPYTWTYLGPWAASKTPRAYTIEFGATGATYKAEGCTLGKLVIKGDVDGDGVWQAQTDWLSQAVSTVAMASLAVRTTELIRVVDTVLSVDLWAGTMGATAAPATLISFQLTVNPNTHLKQFAGAFQPGSFGEAQWDAQLELTLEYNATAKAYIDALVTPALVQRQFRLKATSGTHSATLDFAGTLVNGAKLFDDRDGNVTVKTTWEGTYNTTLTNWLNAVVLNAVATLP